MIITVMDYAQDRESFPQCLSCRYGCNILRLIERLIVSHMFEKPN